MPAGPNVDEVATPDVARDQVHSVKIQPVLREQEEVAGIRPSTVRKSHSHGIVPGGFRSTGTWLPSGT